MSLTITYFVHGTTTDNERDIATGQAHGELSELGKKQAKELGRMIAKMRFDAVFCSDLKRAADSAKLMFGKRYEVIHDRRLRECHYGTFTGHPDAEFKPEMHKYITKPFPKGESYKDVERRVVDLLAFLKEHYKEGRVAVVGHQAPQLALEVLTKGKTWKRAMDEDWRKTKAWQSGWEYVVK
ncbi:MAG: hypothetical protein A2946_00520 [Candidatus Liptonbacteria bacterium RIFCSPLOWO2_01_FULL_53_13]|uniref:Phosphoglycerate mutase n=1 Tax=Candidatus Liptonbacteria bacterium RIFCSPLOWO2_01_FULL_53_13 TaxID=1798651 RepID=A0A1G2CID2_9BACT|nr:MAG: hypothetical protein A2946_00520 [Candidatus Liptonbacteria bacterium RIFCSPLOWO2_01_FULL_53_13]